jgi:beta-phosphoglucomutase-like phosphatase (HAD superfamily)
LYTAKALLLDLDGTLANTIDVLKKTFFDFLLEYKIQSCEDEFQSFNGPPLNTIIKTINDKYKISSNLPDLIKKYNEMLKENYLKALPQNGVRETLDFAIKKNWKCAVVTSNSSQLTKEWLSSHHLDHFFTTIVGSDLYGKAKPNPEPYLLALSLLNTTNSKALAVI